MAEATGGWRNFEARATCSQPEGIWQLWTTPRTWQSWDKGLTSAELEGEFREGAAGSLVGLDGRRSQFVVDEVRTGELIRQHVPLPGGRMTLTRTLSAGSAPAGACHVEHRVRFTGPLSPVWGLLLGRRFRPLLGPTLDALIALAQQPTHRGGAH